MGALRALALNALVDNKLNFCANKSEAISEFFFVLAYQAHNKAVAWKNIYVNLFGGMLDKFCYILDPYINKAQCD